MLLLLSIRLCAFVSSCLIIVITFRPLSPPTDKVLERGERIELLVDRTEVLDQHAFKFKKSSGNLRNAMWWKNFKLKLLIAFIVLGVIYVIAALAW